MLQEMYEQARRIVEQALNEPPERRRAFVDALCAGKPADLATEVWRQIQSAEYSARDIHTQRAETSTPRPAARWDIREVLGQGGMGEVYKAWDPALERFIAVKTFRPDGDFTAAANRVRLLREMKIGGRLAGIPGIVTFYHAQVDEGAGLAFIEMEYVDGPSLDKWIYPGQPLDRDVALNVLGQTAAALDAAHALDIVHCDIKPGNILLQNGKTVKITDFGISRLRQPTVKPETTTVMGTWAYMSPEQIRNLPLDGRSDQYSLGVLAFRLLTGRLPFEETDTQLLFAIVSNERPRASGVRPVLPASVDEPLLRALDANRDRRFSTCSEFVRVLSRALTGTSTAIPMPADEPVTTATTDPNRRIVAPSPAKVPALVWIMLAITILAITGAGAAWKLTRRTPKFPPPSINRFVAERGSGNSANGATLRWEVKDADSVTINPGIGSVAPEGSAQVPMRAPTTYTLNASGKGGQTSASSFVAGPSESGKDQSFADPGKPQPGDRDDSSQGTGDRRESEKTSGGTNPQAGNQNNGAPGDAQAFLRDGKQRLASHDERNARLQFLKAAEGGNPEAMVLLAAMYSEGLGGPQNEPDAVLWFRKAADAGNARGMYNLGHMYANGAGVPKSDAQAANWYGKAVRAGSADAAYRLGMMYERGIGVPRDVGTARELFERANSPEAKGQLSLLARMPAEPDPNASPEKSAPVRALLTALDILPSALKRNDAIQYMISGSAFGLGSTVCADVPQVIVGSRRGSGDCRPVEIGPGGKWLKVYISIPGPFYGQSVRLTVRNPDGQSAHLQVPALP
jgi:serine/threonine protein kinase